MSKNYPTKEAIDFDGGVLAIKHFGAMGNSISRRMVPGKLLVIAVEKEEGAIKGTKAAEPVIDARIVMSGKAPEGEHQPEDGDLIKYQRGGQQVNIESVEMTLINYSQILYFP